MKERMQGSVEEDPDMERKRAESAQMAWGSGKGQGSRAFIDALFVRSAPPVTIAGAETGSAETEASQKPVELTGLSTEMLEAELKRRKKTDSETPSS